LLDNDYEQNTFPLPWHYTYVHGNEYEPLKAEAGQVLVRAWYYKHFRHNADVNNRVELLKTVLPTWFMEGYKRRPDETYRQSESEN
jgi:hypothetical protein